MVPFGDGEAPATMMASILSLEFLIHAWDFAQVTGHPIEVPDGLVAYVQGLAETVIRPEYRGEGKGFATQTTPSSPDPMTVLAASQVAETPESGRATAPMIERRISRVRRHTCFCCFPTKKPTKNNALKNG